MYKKYSEGFIMSEIISVSSDSGTNTARFMLKCVKFTIVSYMVSVLLLAALAVIIVYTDVSEKISGPSIKGIKFFGAFLSALLTSKSCETKGWLYGVIAGMFNIALLMVIGSFFVDSPIFSASNIAMLALGGLCGMVGGIIGVNLADN